jgi:hypothetical protein
LWYRHLGYHDDTAEWADDGAEPIGEGWIFKQVFAGLKGSIYTVTDNGDLMYYRNAGYLGGAGEAGSGWLYGSGVQVGNGWNFEHIFAGDGGSIYAITSTGDLLYYRHDGYLDGSATWWPGGGTVVGNGWNNLAQVFAGPEGAIYTVDREGVMRYYKHYGYLEGTYSWCDCSGTVIGSGWNFVDVMAIR